MTMFELLATYSMLKSLVKNAINNAVDATSATRSAI